MLPFPPADKADGAYEIYVMFMRFVFSAKGSLLYLFCLDFRFEIFHDIENGNVYEV